MKFWIRSAKDDLKFVLVVLLALVMLFMIQQWDLPYLIELYN